MQFPFLKKISKKQRIQALFVLGGMFGIACIYVIAMNIHGITVQESHGVEDVEDPIIYRDAFTGERLWQPEENPRVACVMVENSADAWPLSGIEDAFFVIEAPVEGSIPRFMACYEEGAEVEKIGPVRSARPYYVSWASGLSALYAHVGGSPEALATLASSSYVTDLNEFWNGASFWRDSVRYAPHNAYTSTALLWAAADRLALKDAQTPGWTYSDATYTQGKQPCNDVVVYWASASVYSFTWSCNEETGTYTRFQGNGTMNTSQKTYNASNVIIMESNITSVDEVDRRHIVTEGTGNAKLCTQGHCTDGVWYKEGVDKPLQFFTSYPDEPFVFTPGKTWVEVVDDLGMVQVAGQVE